jgi:hypothetical protein
MKVLLSYPRSGNHLVRFFIELLTETPTMGCKENKNDTPIYQNTFPVPIPFCIGRYDTSDVYHKYHTPPPEATELLFILRNPKEVLLRHSMYQYNQELYDSYFELIQYYDAFQGKKILFYYEDILTNKKEFIEQLSVFIHAKESKKQFVLQNIDRLYELSKQGTGRSWGGVHSPSIHYYYDKLKNKSMFDNYLAQHKYTCLAKYHQCQCPTLP